jgi:hypothetical protein
MNAEATKPANVFRFAAGCIVIGFLLAVVYLLFRQISGVRGVAAGFGIMASLFGSGASIWFALRGRERKMMAVALLSLLPFGFWCWVIYRVVYGS